MIPGRPIRIAALAIAIASATSAAHAQSTEPAPSGDAVAQAREHNDKALRHYDLGQYDEAIDEFKRAYQLSPTPGLLFNIAQAYRLRGTAFCGEALRFYRTYLRQQPDAPNHALVETRVQEMERCALEHPPPPPAPVASATTERPPPKADVAPAPAPPSAKSPWLPIVTMGAGAILAGVGVGLYASAASSYASLSSSECGTTGTCKPATYQGARTRESAGIGLAAGGGTLVVGGLVWFLLLPRRGNPPAMHRTAAWIRLAPRAVSAGAAF